MGNRVEMLDEQLKAIPLPNDNVPQELLSFAVNEMANFTLEEWAVLTDYAVSRDKQWRIALIPLLRKQSCQEAFLLLQLFDQSEQEEVKYRAADAIYHFAGFSRGIYHHYKGHDYELLEVARHTETLDWQIVYRALYGEKRVWARPAAMWLEIVTGGVKRFEKA
jgi:hypothetical protein